MHKLCVFSRVITLVNAQNAEFVAIYTSKALTIDTHEIAREHSRTRVNGHAAFTRRLCAPLN